MDRLNVVVPTEIGKEGEEKRTKWTKVGVAFPNKHGTGWNIVLDFPIGATRYNLMPVENKDRPQRAKELDFPPG